VKLINYKDKKCQRKQR